MVEGNDRGEDGGYFSSARYTGSAEAIDGRLRKRQRTDTYPTPSSDGSLLCRPTRLRIQSMSECETDAYIMKRQELQASGGEDSDLVEEILSIQEDESASLIKTQQQTDCAASPVQLDGWAKSFFAPDYFNQTQQTEDKIVPVYPDRSADAAFTVKNLDMCVTVPVHANSWLQPISNAVQSDMAEKTADYISGFPVEAASWL